MKNKTLFVLLLLVLIGADFGYSFFQHAGKTLDGDLPGGILPTPDVRPVLNDPLGISAITEGRVYPNPNRFFSHASFYTYFNTVPFALQTFLDPVSSIYYSSAIFKILVQFGLIFLIASLLAGKNKPGYFLLICAFLILPFFQTNGFQSEIGIIDSSITYTFFYAFPLLILLTYCKPLFHYFLGGKLLNTSISAHLYRLILAFPVCLSGPLNPGIILVITVMILINYGYDYLESKFKPSRNKQFEFPFSIFLFMLPVTLLAIYSLYLGSYNYISIANEKPILDLYRLLLQGIYHEMIRNVGLLFLLGSVAIQFLILFLNGVYENKEKVKSIYFWSFIFCFLYIFLLPLGGFREYRPEILRYDTLMPVTLNLIFLFVYSLLVIYQENRINKRIYGFFIASILVFFTVKDAPEFQKNGAEKRALYLISDSDQEVVHLKDRIQIISWAPLTRPDESLLVGEMLYKYNITGERKVFYYKE